MRMEKRSIWEGEGDGGCCFRSRNRSGGSLRFGVSLVSISGYGIMRFGDSRLCRRFECKRSLSLDSLMTNIHQIDGYSPASWHIHPIERRCSAAVEAGL